MANDNKKAAYEIEVDGKKFRLSAPSRHVLKIVYAKLMRVSGELNLIEAGEIILNSCWVDGDPEIKTDDTLFIPACLKAAELIEQKEATLKKL